MIRYLANFGFLSISSNFFPSYPSYDFAKFVHEALNEQWRTVESFHDRLEQAVVIFSEIPQPILNAKHRMAHCRYVADVE